MKNFSLFPKILLYIAVLSGTLWFGTYLARLTAAYQLFEGNYFHVAGYITPQNLPGILMSMNALIILSGIAYIVFIISYFSFIAASKISLKQNGWLFIITVIIAVTMPFEAYLMSIDLKIYSIVILKNFNAKEVFNLYVSRMKSLSSFPIIELICYSAVVYFALFRPLNKKIL